MGTFADRQTRVALVLGNRADITTPVAPTAVSRVMGWIRDSYINICMSYPMDTLEISLSGSIPAGTASIPYPDDCRAIQAITFTNPNDGTTFQPDWKDLQYLRMFNTSNPGPPSVWTTQKQQLLLAPTPDKQYDYIIDYWQLPQIIGDGDVVDPNESTVDISATPILLPYDWLEILDYGAEMRGHAELLEREKATALQQLLFGFTIPLTNKFVPGMIGQILTRRQAQAPYVDYGMAPRSTKREFTNTGR